MNIQSIRLINWKCFKEETFVFNNHVNIINKVNGYGKSSMIESIIFCLTGKRPSGLDFDSLRNNLDEQCKLTLHFSRNFEDYKIHREFGKKSIVEIYKNNNLIGRSISDLDNIINKIIPQSYIDGLWCLSSLISSPILKTDYLFNILEAEFKEPLEYKQEFLSNRTFAQKQISAIKKSLSSNTDGIEDKIKKLSEEIKELENQIKSRVFIDDNDVVQAKKCQSDYQKYLDAKERATMLKKAKYDIDLTRELYKLVRRYNINSQDDFNSFINETKEELELEKNKANKTHPLAKYNKQVINDIIKESSDLGYCLFCGKKLDKNHRVEINYDSVDNKKIKELEQDLEYSKYNYNDIISSSEYYKAQKEVSDLSYVNEIDWKSILEKYDADAKQLYIDLENKKEEYNKINNEFNKVNELLELQIKYDDYRDGINIVDEFIAEAKAYYSNAILSAANSYLTKINTRYRDLFIENGVYKVKVLTESYDNESILPVLSLSAGEKTIIALILILAIRNLFVEDIPLIMDEAFSNLDGSNRENILNILREETRQWIIVSHDAEFVL